MEDNNGGFLTWERSINKRSPQKRKDALNITLSISPSRSTSNPTMPTVEVDFKFSFRKTKSCSDLVMDF